MKKDEISLITKKTLADTLKNIMRRKAFSKITVTEIIQSCGMNRNTFYYHFEDIYDLLRWTLLSESTDLIRHFNVFTDYENAIRAVVNYLEENRYIISCAYDSIGHDELKRFFYSDFIAVTSAVIDLADKEADTHLEPDFKEFLAKFYAKAFAETILDWITEEQMQGKEKMVRYLTAVIQHELLSFKN